MKHELRNYQKAYRGEKLSRKAKKQIFGPRISKKALREEINAGILNHCPMCRHRLIVKSTGNMTFYPEVWEYHYCAKCDLIIGGQDNSYPVDIMEAAQYILDEVKKSEDLQYFGTKPPTTLYEAVRYIGYGMKDYI